MSSRVLTPDVVGIDALVHDHQTVLAKAEGGVVAVFANNAPAFYAITPARLAELLALEEKLARPGSDVALDDQLYQEPQTAPVAVPMGKFAMYPDWQPDADFIRLAALWGVALREPVTAEELASFIAYWHGRQSLSPCAVATKTGAQPANRSCQQRRTAETRCEYGQ